VDDWYEIVDERDLAQGDILLHCPVARVETFAHPLPDDLEVVVDRHHLIMLSQSCDLVNDKVDDVLLAAVLDYRDLVAREGNANPVVKSKKFRKGAVDGNLPSYSLLPPFDGVPNFEWSLVDFHHLFTLPKVYAEEFAEAAGARLRLVPPYREHLAQAFSRYMMRVGLPTPLGDFEGLQV
jgi:hypothetical protein